MNRRGFLRTGLIGASALTLAGCKVLDGTRDADSGLRGVMEGANRLTYRAQRLLQGNGALAPEYTQADIRQAQHPNGSVNPDGEDYRAMAANGFADYALTVNGLVENPLTLPRDTLTAMPSRTQITRHDCVEGWSCIAEWTGVPLAHVLDQARPTAAARYVVFNCYDAIERGLSGVVTYYESIDLADARHPQTILAYGMNGAPLPVANGAPLRVRIERQLGYKMAKYIHTITLVPDLAGFGRGKGGYWEDRGYDWYAGI
jgi:DMSO/TMAO reductase YedYZ molybdopterin-dependent catalytic subunit